MKVFTGGIITETNTYAPFATTREDWHTSDEQGGSGIEPLLDLISGLAEERGWSTVTGFHAMAEPAGKTDKATWEHLKSRLLEDLEAALPVDLVVMPLHGAMVAEDCDDCEGEILSEVREIVGPSVPVGVGLDAHAHLSEKMVQAADILVFMKEWPHIDVPETIENAFKLTAELAEGRIRPCMSVWNCRMIAPYHTLEEPMKSLVDEMKAAEATEHVLSVSLVHGFWHADVPDMGSKMLVISNNAPEKGRALAKSLGRRLFGLRGQTCPGYLDLQEGLDAVESGTRYPVVLADTGDIPGGGAPGDATYILEGLLKRGIGNCAIAYIWDPESVDQAICAGRESEVLLNVGGKACSKSGHPLSLTCKVTGVYKNHGFEEGDGSDSRIGDVAVVHAQGIDIALARERVAALSSRHFETIGIDPVSKRVLVVKSANNFYAGFEAIAGKTLYVDAGGVTGGQINDLEPNRIKRPMWPFDENPFGGSV